MTCIGAPWSDALRFVLINSTSSDCIGWRKRLRSSDCEANCIERCEFSGVDLDDTEPRSVGAAMVGDPWKLIKRKRMGGIEESVCIMIENERLQLIVTNPRSDVSMDGMNKLI